MKSKLYFMLMAVVCFSNYLFSQNTFPSSGKVGIGTLSPDASSLLEIRSTTKGILIPRMTQAQRNAIISPANGLMIYQTDNNPGFFYYTGANWIGLAPKSKTWNVTGNSGFDSASNFIGNTDNVPFSIRTSNVERVHVSSNGNIGIGTTTPQAKLDLKGDARINGLTAGRGSGNNVSNSAFGNQALYNNTSGYSNVAIGTHAFYSNAAGNQNIAIGDSALYNSTGTFYSNTALGSKALYNGTSAYDNTALGFQALYSTTTGGDNTAIGHALYYNTAGSINVGIGYNALFSNTTGSSNVGLGNAALIYNTTGGYNTGVGTFTLSGNSTGSYNTGVGYDANINADGITNASAVGYAANATASNQVMLGNSSVTAVEAYGPYYNLSDGRIKKNIKENVPGLAFINSLRPVTYNYDIHTANSLSGLNTAQNKTGNDVGSSSKLSASTKPASSENSAADKVSQDAMTAKEKIQYTGFVAQEVESAAKKLNYDFSGVHQPQNDKDLYALSYSDFVVPLVKAVQELSKQNDTKDSAINDLQNQINQLKALIVSSANTNQSALVSSASLQQNIPNPFSSATTIGYNLPSNYSSASIIVTDAKGVVLKQISLNAKGKGNVQLDASTLASGAYRYALYIDGRMVDSKQMISSK